MYDFLLKLLAMQQPTLGQGVQQNLGAQPLIRPDMSAGTNLQAMRNQPWAQNQSMQNFLAPAEHEQMIREAGGGQGMGGAAMATPYEMMKLMAGQAQPISPILQMILRGAGGGGPAQMSQPNPQAIIAALRGLR